MSWATVKNTKKQRSNPRLLRRSVGNFFVKFAPSSLIVTLGYAIGVVSCCMEMNGSEVRLARCGVRIRSFPASQ